jgi:NADH-quinone oxidoreductase subunit G
MTPPGTTFDEPYSMNVIDICPVGALTSVDFRFKARIWEMSKTASVTTANAKGSNCYYWVKNNRIMKVTPRDNPDVNAYWLPDEDRLDYHRFNDDRPAGPSVDGQSAGWDAAYDAAAALLRNADPASVVFLGSAHATVEDNFLLSRLATSLGCQAPSYIPHVEKGHGDGWLRTDDRTPNASGCALLGIRPVDADSLRSRVQSGSVSVLYILEDDPVAAGLVAADDLADVQVILHAYNTTNQTVASANVLLPAATAVETVGTFVSCDGMAQRVRPAKSIRGMNRTLMMEIGKSRHDLHGTPFDRWHDESNLIDCHPGWVSVPEIAGRLDVPMEYAGPRAIMVDVAESVPGFGGVTYEKMGDHGVRIQEAGQPA